MLFLNRTADPLDLDRGRACLICGAPWCSCQTWMTAVVRRPVIAEDTPPPQTRTINPKTYTRKANGR